MLVNVIYIYKKKTLTHCNVLQILKEIWEEVSASYHTSWLEVLEFRETHLCSPKKAIEGLKYQIQERQFQEQQRSYPQSNSDYISNNSRYTPYVHQHIMSPTLPSNHSFPPLTTHTHLPMPIQPAVISPTHCVYNNGYYPNNYTTYGVVSPVCNFPNPNMYGHAMKQPCNGGYYCNGYVPQTCAAPVPTAQLIEIEPPSRSNYDFVDGTIKQQKTNYISDDNYNKTSVDLKINSPIKSYEKDEVTGTFESWDYVYRNLESQGYSKDLGERGDVLSVNRRESKQREHELKVSDRPMKINEALEKLRLHDIKTKKPEYKPERRASSEGISSSYDNLSAPELVRKPKSKSNITAVKCEESESQMQQFSKTLDFRKSKALISKNKPPEKIAKYAESPAEKDKEHARQKDSDNWQCATCTYLNDSSKKICDICSKSRIVVNQEMEIGGSECSKCTLVNPKTNKICEACSATLQDSPTYI